MYGVWVVYDTINYCSLYLTHQVEVFVHTHWHDQQLVNGVVSCDLNMSSIKHCASGGYDQETAVVLLCPINRAGGYSQSHPGPRSIFSGLLPLLLGSCPVLALDT